MNMNMADENNQQHYACQQSQDDMDAPFLDSDGHPVTNWQAAQGHDLEQRKREFDEAMRRIELGMHTAEDVRIVRSYAER